MFSQARWRLTLWFAAALTLIMALTSGAVFLSARAALFDQVKSDLRSRATREVGLLAARLVAQGRDEPLEGIAVGPATAGSYFYALLGPDGTVLGSTANTDPQAIVTEPDDLASALTNGSLFVDTRSSEGDHLRVNIVPVQGPRGRTFLLEVGRSTEAERNALRRLVLILAGGGGAGLVLALGGGFFLAGLALRPIQTAMDRQRAFVADASHELRTPLALIRANAELLKRHPGEPVSAGMQSVDDIVSETDRLSGLVGQMLTLASADTGQAPLQMTEVDLTALTADTVRQMRVMADARGTSIEVEAPNGALPLRGDAARLRELLLILLDNAVKYGGERGPIQVRVAADQGKARVQVSDSGPGIPREALPRLFDRFYRVDKARSREMGGTGLGLSIARWIAESHEGSIRVESEPGRGTTVTVELPAPGAA
ncbi:MAG TPA: ATP-binding protein [Dehalococcoidia bacterium]|nr:ATP-binding protein [Dehalococcoidia bacterium]